MQTEPPPRQKQPEPPVCLKSAQMWLDQAKADFKAALFLLEQIGMDESMEICPFPDQQIQETESNAFPGLVCFLCHETVEKCLKGIMYAFCGLPHGLLNHGQLVTLIDPLKQSKHVPKDLKQPLEECVMQINQHEHKSRLPNYQNPPCAPAAIYTHQDAKEATIAVRHLVDQLVKDDKLRPLLSDMKLPTLKFQSTLKSIGQGTEGKI